MKIVFCKNVEAIFKKHKIYMSPSQKYDRVINKEINISRKFSSEPYCSYNNGFSVVSLGSFSYFNSVVPANDLNMSVGRYCSIGDNLSILGINHPIDRFTTSSVSYDNRANICRDLLEDSNFKQKENPNISNDKSIVIGNDVWIGSKVTLSRGIKINDGAIIASGSIVTKDVPPYAIVGGIPARILKFRFNSDIIYELQKSRWWEFKFTDFEISSDCKIEEFITYIHNSNLTPFQPEPLTFDKINSAIS